MPYKEKPIEKLYYSIGEVANMFNVNTSLIRFWEKEFAIIKPTKNNKGNRLFSKQDVDHFHTIYHLVKESGYTLAGAKEKLSSKKPETDVEMEVVIKLKKIKNFLLDLKETLD